MRFTGCSRRIRGLPGQRVRELIVPLGFDGGKTIVDDHLREVRPLFAAARNVQRTIYRPGEASPICGSPRRGGGRSRPGPQGVRGGGVPGVFARRCRRPDLLQAVRGSAVRDRASTILGDWRHHQHIALELSDHDDEIEPVAATLTSQQARDLAYRLLVLAEHADRRAQGLT